MMSEHFDILIIEDDPTVRQATAKALRHEDLTVDEIGDPQEGATRLETCRYGVVLCDLMLPGASGLDLLLTGRRVCRETPFVMITGYATVEKTLDSFRAGAFDFLPKPFDAAELTGVVERAQLYSASPGGDHARRAIAGDDTGESCAERYRLGDHSWVSLQPDGSAIIGIGNTFTGTLHNVDRVDLPEVGEHALQSKRLARITCGNRAVHRVWAPLSGPIIAVNSDLRRDPGLLCGGAREGTWLVRVVPSQADIELPLLIHD